MTASSTLATACSPPSAGSLAVELRAVSKSHQAGVPVLRDVNLQIPHGSLTTLLGPSGCGKSTLLRLVAGLDQPTQGEVWIDGEPVTHLRCEDRAVSLVFQNYALFPHLDVLGNVGFGLKMLGLPPVAQRERALAALTLVGLSGFASRSSVALSGGQQQRVALARALAIEPRVLLLDEPLSNLDARLRHQMREEIRGLQKRLGLTVVYVTHDQAEALAVSDQVVVMHDGCIQQVGSPQEIYKRPVDAQVAAFMGDALILDARCDRDGRWRLASCPVDDSVLPLLEKRPGHLQLMVRPEAWQLAAASRSGLPGKILRRAYLGRCTEYLVQVAWGELWVVVWGAGAALQVDAPVSLSLGQSGVSVLNCSTELTPHAVQPPFPKGMSVRQA
jgi:iron(III) transport system ATP-binding protein